ncbi:hypothetical protein [Fundidesulfovibrio terrae]|uniref:hypothetical protein n=1 Tax=Fundidesulfovibrio terrae TaxID=2922866 RepID=UPI001FAEE6CD|nr:hypothetical protein [Fundidesulfovibrio terrae]
MPYPAPEHPGTAGKSSDRADQQALNELRYKRYLEHLAGFEPGESDLSDEEILSRRAARNSGVQRLKSAMTVVSGPGMACVPFEAVLGQLKARPGMVEHLEGIDLDGDGVADISFAPHPMDYAGQMRWQAMARERAQKAALRKFVNNKVLLAHLEAHDPLFPHVKHFVESFIRPSPKGSGAPCWKRSNALRARSWICTWI